jgi:hypothetical protein
MAASAVQTGPVEYDDLATRADAVLSGRPRASGCSAQMSPEPEVPASRRVTYPEIYFL